MTIPNKQILESGDIIGTYEVNKLQTNFEQWIANHHHTNKKIPILILESDSKIEELISNDDFLYNFTNKIINTDTSFSEYNADFIVLKMTYLSELYNKSILLGKENLTLKSLIYSYSSSYKQEDDIFYFIFKNVTISEDDLNIILEIPALENNGQFSFENNQYFQQSQNIYINKNIIKNFIFEDGLTSVLTFEIDLLENAFIGIPSLPISAYAIIDDSGQTAVQHVSDTSKHVSSFATESGLMQNAQFNLFAYPNWTANHPLFTDGKFLVTCNDKTLSLNVIKNENSTNSSTMARANDKPMDAMFRGNSQNLNWLRTNYYSTETRKDASVALDLINDNYNYDISGSETTSNYQSYRVNDLIPTKQISGSPALFFDRVREENRAVGIIRDSEIGIERGSSFVRLPITIKLSPNKHEKSYMYTFYYGKLSNNLSNSYIGNFKGSGVYSSEKTNFEYNISKDLYFEKTLILGSPYEPFNIGAEHIYSKSIVKDFSNPDSNFDGFRIISKNISEVKKEESRLL